MTMRRHRALAPLVLVLVLLVSAAVPIAPAQDAGEGTGDANETADDNEDGVLEEEDETADEEQVPEPEEVGREMWLTSPAGLLVAITLAVIIMGLIVALYVRR